MYIARFILNICLINVNRKYNICVISETSRVIFYGLASANSNRGRIKKPLFQRRPGYIRTLRM